jgi:hypothetical protein
MGVELRQETNQPSETAGFVADQKQARIAHMQANARILTTIQGTITQTSPGVITGTGGDTTMSLPGGAVPCGIRYFNNIGANTAATITVGIDTTSAYFLSAQAVTIPGQHVPTAAALNLFTPLAALPIGQAHTVTGSYAETATSATGTISYVEIDYYLPLPA